MTAPRSSVPIWARWLVWLAMGTAQIPVGVAALRLESVAWIGLIAVPTVLIAVLADRPALHRPPGHYASDWGRTLGHGWMKYGTHTTHYVPGHELDEVKPAPVTPRWDHAGFTLDVPEPEVGLPPPLALFKSSVNTLTAPLVVGSLAGGLFNLGPGWTLWDTVLIGLISALGGYVFYAILLVAPIGLYALVRNLWAARVSRQSVTLNGRTVRREDGATFRLGAPNQAIRQDGQRLMLSSDDGYLDLYGAAAHLAFLATAFEEASHDIGDAADVPETLRRLEQVAE